MLRKSSSSAAGSSASSTTTSRLPFRPRDVNTCSRAESVTSLGSKASSGFSGGSGLSKGGGGNSSTSLANKYLHSYLESSNNPNNQRISASASASSSAVNIDPTTTTATTDQQPAAAGTGTGTADSSTVANTGGGLKIPILSSSASSKAAASSSATAAATAAAAAAAAPKPKSSSSSSRQKPQVVPEDHDEIEIVEHRKKASGDGYTVHRYIRGRLLGKGGFAKVYWCTSLDTNRHYAVKIVPKANLVKSRARQKLQAEIKIHRSLKHDNVCEYKHFFEDKVNCYILLELCHNQSMNEMIKRRKRLTEPEVKYYMKQLLHAVRYMHDINVIHRDLKLGNLFLDKNLNVKVGDFGLATRLSSSDEKRKTICGTPNYIAPEVIDGNKEKRGHSFEVDIWSMGVICFTTLVGKPPYESKDVKSTYQRILANQYEFPSHVPISGHARDLISAMLQTNPKKRPTLDQIAAHSFFTHGVAMIPKTVPLSGTHIAPDWQEDANGKIYAVEKASDEKYRRPTITSRRKKTATTESTVSKLRASSSERPALVPKNANAAAPAASATASAKNGSGATSESKRQPAPPSSSSKFNIFEEGKESERKASGLHENPPQSDLFSNGQAVATATVTTQLTTPPSASNTASSPTSSTADKDMHALEVMHSRLQNAFESAGTASQRSKSTPATTPQPDRWVTRYVDYTSKYGLGFLLNDGSAGVYFNDSTKSVLGPEGETFMYVERRRVGNVNEHVYEMHTLSSYPEALQKKVTLLKHFRNYLVEQQKKAEEEEEQKNADGSVDTDANRAAVEVVTSRVDDESSTMIYLKKWVRTKHAILFRLSNGTVQVVFYDHTEVLLSDEAKIVTYVDKKRHRTTYRLDDVTIDPSQEIGKRLKYAKDILKQLLPGSKSPS